MALRLWLHILPKGFVDSGEEVYSALKREFCEEAMNCGEVTGEAWKEMEDNIRQLFENGTVVSESKRRQIV